MQKAEPQHNHAQNQPAQRQGGNASLEPPQGEQIAQLEAMVEAGPQTGRLAQLAAAANNSPSITAQRKAISAIHNSPNVTAQRRQLDSITGETAQREEADEPLQAKVAQREDAPAKPNNTGLPDNLKSGIESLSGMSMDNVKVHYNSSQPAQLNALAYAQGTDIHVAPGQERHLPHEAWHVVQQAQGRVKPTVQMKDGVPVNDDQGLEREADAMGGKALDVGASLEPAQRLTESMRYRPVQFMHGQVQRLMDKIGVDKKGYAKACWNTVYLYAYYEGEELGLFHTTSDGHAEENLIKYVREKGLRDGKLTIYLSTSPCSSIFGTRDDGHPGCQEQLEELSRDLGIALDVKAAHLYIKQDLRSQEVEEFGAQGASSYGSAVTSEFPMTFEKLPKAWYEKNMIGDEVVQLARDGRGNGAASALPACSLRVLQASASEGPVVQRAVITVNEDRLVGDSAQIVADKTGAQAGAFDEVEDTETIYIFAHGYHSLTHPLSEDGETNLEPILKGGITAANLYHMMIEEGWRKEHTGAIDLRACMSGAESLLPSFAELFALELKKAGRSNVVTGYKHLTQTKGDGTEVAMKPTVSKMIAVARQFDAENFRHRMFAMEVTKLFEDRVPGLLDYRNRCDGFEDPRLQLGLPPDELSTEEWGVYSYYHALETKKGALIEILKNDFSRNPLIEQVVGGAHDRQFNPDELSPPEQELEVGGGDSAEVDELLKALNDL